LPRELLDLDLPELDRPDLELAKDGTAAVSKENARKQGKSIRMHA
jgi:hypothetical protein